MGEELELLKRSEKLSQLNLPNVKNLRYKDEKAVIAGFGYEWITDVTYNKETKEYDYKGGSSYKMKFAECTTIDVNRCKDHHAGGRVYDTHVCAKVTQRFIENKLEGACVVRSFHNIHSTY